MTTPTKAQIEAAARAIFTARMTRANPADWDCTGEAKAALTAAAEVKAKQRDADVSRAYEAGMRDGKAITAAAGVGEPSTLDYAIGANFSLAQENEKLRKELAATIERCAQVAKAAAAKALEDHQRCKDSKDAAVDHYLWCHDEAVAIEAAIRALKDRT